MLADILEERLHVETALSLLDIERLGTLSQRDNDPPDFQFEFTTGEIVSIEHTRAFRLPDEKGIVLQREEKERDEIVTIAERDIQSADIPNVLVNVDFRDSYGLLRNESVDLDKQKRKPIANAIRQLVLDNLPAEGEQVRLSNSCSEKFPPEIEHIHIWRYPRLKATQFFAEGSALIPSLTPDIVRNIIARKDCRLSAYRRDFSQNWLVVVESHKGLASEFDFETSHDALEYKYESDFDRILLLRYRWRSIIELFVNSR